MRSVRLSRAAADYLRGESTDLRERSPAAARALSETMKRAHALLQQFPEVGNTHHGLQVAGFRTLVAGEYLIDYRLTESAIEIANIRHGRMQIPMPELDDPDARDLGSYQVSMIGTHRIGSTALSG